MAAAIPPDAPIEVFFSYSHKDEELRNELEEHLALMKRQGIVATWHDRRITPGAEWSDEIDSRLERSRLILLLVSSSFLASDYCYGKEMSLALERHFRGEVLVIPVIVRPVDWRSAPFARIQGLPLDAKPVTLWTNRDQAWTDVAQGIRRAIAEFAAGHPGIKKTAPASFPMPAARPVQPSPLLSVPDSAMLDPSEVRKAKRALRAIIGPIADVITAEKVAKARSLSQLYQLLAVEISSKKDREAFLRMLTS
ncbi:MAG: toll/interleukin-1 receptor domain-containing protein [Isosphaeraceae bacterium]